MYNTLASRKGSTDMYWQTASLIYFKKKIQMISEIGGA